MGRIILATALFFGLTPALRATRTNVVPELKNETPASPFGGRRIDLRSLLASLLYEISTHDARVFIITPMVLIAATLLAASVPAWRATRVDPLRALRYE